MSTQGLPTMRTQGSLHSVGVNPGHHDPDWEKPDELKNKLGFPTLPKQQSFWLWLFVFLTKWILVICVVAATVWSRLSHLSLVARMFTHNIQPTDVTLPASVAPDTAPTATSAPTPRDISIARASYAATCIAIIVPYVWEIFWRFLRTPLVGNTLFHIWPRTKTTALLVIGALLEAAGVTIFSLAVAPRVAPLVQLGMMALVFFDPVYLFRWAFSLCFGPPAATTLPHSTRGRGRQAWGSSGTRYSLIATSVNDNDDDDDSDGMRVSNTDMHYYSPEDHAAANQFPISKTIGVFLQFALIGVIPLYAMLTKDENLKTDISYIGPIAIVVLSFSWSTSLQQWIDRLLKDEIKSIHTPLMRRSRGNNRTHVYVERENEVGPQKRLQASSRDRAILISHVFRAIFALAFIVAHSYFDTIATPCNKHSAGLHCDVWNDLSAIRDYADEVLYPLLGLCLCSFAAFHLGKYAMSMGFNVEGFAFPLNFSWFFVALVIVIMDLTLPTAPAYLYFQKSTRNEHWYLYVLYVAVSYVSLFLCNMSMSFERNIPKLALNEALFYQPAFNVIFMDQFGLICRRIGKDEDTNKFVVETERELEMSRLFICTTMYNEDEEEMTQLLTSVLTSAEELVDRCELQSHIFMDGGMKTKTEPGNPALRLISTIYKTADKLKTAEKISFDGEVKACKKETPYGFRVEFTIGKTKLTIHLKNPQLINKGKRWSQVMYMFYIIRYLMDTEVGNEASSKKSYILATDADIVFGPDDVTALLMMISRDKSVGAVCGRTHPLGSGPLVWYQKFDYAVGHWFQKAAEHVLGTVLCCPGCFSLYRVDALREVVLDYSSHVEKAVEFLTKDMGEDRWLCTLLVLKGWRLEYCAASIDKTFCPTDFKVFFNQRRRWIVSTVANMIEILKYTGTAVKLNRSISFLYILYTGLMVGSMVVSPATVLLVMLGGFDYVLSWDLVTVEVILFVISLGYVFICLWAKQDTQILIAKLLTVLFAIIMAVVFIGLLAQVADDIASSTKPVPSHTTSTTQAPPHTPPHLENATSSFFYDNATFSMPAEDSETILGRLPAIGSGNGKISVSTVYLLSMIGMFLLAGFLHLREFTDLVHGVWYLLCLPTGYLLLLIYACCNLNDRSWGTRTVGGDGLNLDGSVPTQVSSTPWWKLLLYGCGLQKKESLLHFLGRALCCCRKYNEEDDIDVEEERKTVAKQKNPPRPPLPWTITRDVGYGAASEYRVTSQAVTKAINQLMSSNRNSQALHQAIKEAILSGPILSDRAHERNAPWADAWNSELHALHPQYLSQLAQDNDAARAMADDFQCTMEELSIQLKEDQDVHQRRANGLAQYACKIKNFCAAQDWTRRLDSESCDLLAERFIDYGFTNSFFIGYMEEKDLATMGINKLLNGEVLLCRIVEKVREERERRPEYPPEITQDFETWLFALDLGMYWSHFHFYGFRRDDITDYNIMRLLTPTRLREMGVVKLAHLRCLSHALAAVQARLKDAHDLQQENAHSELGAEHKKFKEVKQVALSPREKRFWVGALKHVMAPNDKGLRTDTLKTKLEELRNLSVLGMVIINMMWLILMLVLNGRVASHLRLFDTNFLGVLFILTFGALFLLQFLTMLVHRVNTFSQSIATLNVTKKNRAYIPEDADADADELHDSLRNGGLSAHRSNGRARELQQF